MKNRQILINFNILLIANDQELLPKTDNQNIILKFTIVSRKQYQLLFTQ